MLYLLKKHEFYLATIVLAICFFVIWVKWFKPITINGLPKVPDGYSWKLAFDDEFSGNALDTNKWNTCYDTYDPIYKGCTNRPNNELEWYTKTGVNVKDGSAFLTATKQQTFGIAKNSIISPGKLTEFPYQSGMISTGKMQPQSTVKWSGTYGYYVMRARLPSGTGLWPAFWLLPANDMWPPEIDVMEMLGNNPHKILMTYFWPNGSYPPPKNASTYKGENYSDGWHTFAIDWHPGRIDWYIDGVRRKTVKDKNVPSVPMQIIVDLAVGGKLPGNPNASTNFPAYIQIDYVRAYQLRKNS